MKLFKKKNPRYEFLRKRWIARHKENSQNLLDKHLRHVALGSVGSLVLLGTHNVSLPASPQLALNVGNQTTLNLESSQNRLLATELVDKLPLDNLVLSKTQEDNITSLINKDLGIKVKAEIAGKRLNRTYGLIGGEQHLYRYPGDTIYEHAKDAQDWAMYSNAGMAPGLGAWGYFAPSKEQFSSEDDLRERYYIAVQTFLSPGFSERVAEYRDFYKYRKMLVVNPTTGQAVVADIADAGPSEWTGKHLGGSPEVMQELGLAGGPRKGAVLYFFIDDSQKDIPLGPVKIKGELSKTI